MALEKYREKRKFERTPEPAGEVAAGDGRLRYCVQRHHASHLHYDLRLEMDGVLKSWAVPKGPTLDPAEKRLAMMVEDHPIEYGGFEGVIPKGNYGAGSVMLWDRGTYEVLEHADLAGGDFKFRVNGEKIKGDFAIVRTKRGKGNEWLLIKKKDAHAKAGWDPEDHARSVLTGRTQEEIAQGIQAEKAVRARDLSGITGAVKAPLPKSISPMLAEIGKGQPPAGEDWLCEVKWDGVRAICTIEDGQVHMVSRDGQAVSGAIDFAASREGQERDSGRGGGGAERARRAELRTIAAPHHGIGGERDCDAGS
jgi:bifunctional non-homologous end joining protein LigD